MKSDHKRFRIQMTYSVYHIGRKKLNATNFMRNVLQSNKSHT